MFGGLIPSDYLVNVTPSSHRLTTEVDIVTKELIEYGTSEIDESEGWQIFAKSGQMRLYRKLIDVNGVPVDPLRATHSIKGVTANEVCHYFYEVPYKIDWDNTLKDVKLVERFSGDTMVVHQVHTWILMTAQRESLFWSHLVRRDECKDDDALDLIAVINHDTPRNDVPLASKGNIRVKMKVAMVCQTILATGVTKSTASRNDITCRINYVSEVSPGGWISSPTLLRQVYKKKYPEFLRHFTSYVQLKTKGKPAVF